MAHEHLERYLAVHPEMEESERASLRKRIETEDVTIDSSCFRCDATRKADVESVEKAAAEAKKAATEPVPAKKTKVAKPEDGGS